VDTGSREENVSKKVKKSSASDSVKSEKALGVKHSRKHLSEGLQAREQVERFGQKNE
jgi:hypothetical protein